MTGMAFDEATTNFIMTSSPTHHHHHPYHNDSTTTTTRHHHHTMNNRRWSWSHMQQRIRRNRVVGPVFVLLVVITFVSTSTNPTRVVQNRIVPIVEAVPFFRRGLKHFGNLQPNNPNSKRRRTNYIDDDHHSHEDSSSPLHLAKGVATASDIPEPTPPDSTKRKHSSNNNNNNNKKRRTTPLHFQGGAKAKHDYSQYSFPLLPNHKSFAKDKNAEIPFRYLEAYRKEDPARQAVLQSLKWRQEWQVDTILARPQPNYDIAKRILPHYFIGNSATTGHVIFVQRPGLSDLELAKHNGIEVQDMLYQYAYVFEYCWNVLHSHEDDDPNALMISIIDLQGLNLGLLRKPELLNFVKEFVGMIDAHYPTRAYKTYMINAPHWFSMLYKIVSPIMRETTKEKIVLYSAGKDQDAALKEAVGEPLASTLQQALRVPSKKELKAKKEQPHDLALTSDILLDTDMEQQIRNFVMGRLQQEGIPVKPILPLSDNDASSVTSSAASSTLETEPAASY